MVKPAAPVKLSHLERLALGIMLAGARPHPSGAGIVVFKFEEGLKKVIGENGYNGLRVFAEQLKKKELFVGSGDTYVLTARGYDTGQTGPAAA